MLKAHVEKFPRFVNGLQKELEKFLAEWAPGKRVISVTSQEGCAISPDVIYTFFYEEVEQKE